MGLTAPSECLSSNFLQHPPGGRGQLGALSHLSSSSRPPPLDLKVNEGGKSNPILQENEGPLQRQLHIQLHPTATEDAQAGLSHLMTVFHLQRAQLGAVLGQDPTKREHRLEATAPAPSTLLHCYWKVTHSTHGRRALPGHRAHAGDGNLVISSILIPLHGIPESLL